jgi:uncharacterized protein
VYPNGCKRDRSFVHVRNARTGASLGNRIMLAVSVPSRLRGLLGRPRLDAGEGIWLDPCSSIHMFFMKFAIDVLFVDRHGFVVRTAQNVAPWRVVNGGRRARAALEVPTGVVADSRTQPGDQLTLEPVA